MKTIIIAFTTMVVLALTAFRGEEMGSLKINLSNIKKTGKIYISIYRDGEDFPSEKFRMKGLTGEGTDGKCQFQFDEIPMGQYAVALYQDVNGNGKLDKGMFGIPEEPFAFSNNFRPRFGGPSFEKCKFEFKEKNQTLNIEMINSLFGGE